MMIWKNLEETVHCPNRNSFKLLGEYINAGLPVLVMYCLDYWSYELSTVVAGMIGVN
jgi:hypothetical protein